MRFPHVNQLAGIKPATKIPAVETVDDLEQLLQTNAIPAACQWLYDNLEGGCECKQCEFRRAALPHTQQIAQHGPWHWYAVATAWRGLAGQGRSPYGWNVYGGAFSGEFWEDWPPLYVRRGDYVAQERGGPLYTTREFDLYNAFEPHLTNKSAPTLADVDLPLLELGEYLDWRKEWAGRPDSYGDCYGETATDNALVEYWRGRHLIRKERATGARQRVLDALKAKVAPLQPYAVNYAHRALLDPLKAAVAAASPER